MNLIFLVGCQYQIKSMTMIYYGGPMGEELGLFVLGGPMTRKEEQSTTVSTVNCQGYQKQKLGPQP